jgi:amino acid transporter
MAVKRVSREEEIRADIKRLHGMGYAQELYRAMGGFSNFAISFTIISILSGALTLFTVAYNQTGPIAGSVGWPLVSVFVVIVALAMGELASAYPTAGGLYFWASKLGGPGWGWYTGWFNLIGQFAITAGIDYGLATFAVVWINIKAPGIVPDPRTILLAYAIMLVLHALMNIFGVKLVAFLNDVSVWWHIGGVLVIFIALFSAALLFPTPASSGGISNSPFYFGYTNTGYPFWYAFLVGLLLAQYTFTGYDASAHMTEETIGAETRAPWGIVMSVVVSAFAGYILLMGLLISVRDVATTAAGGSALNSVLVILDDRLGADWAFILLGMIVVAQFFCGMASVTANSRMIYAFSRDHAMPLSNLWHNLSKTRRVPVNAIWLAAAAAFILAVPSLWNAVAYGAVTSIAVIGLYVAYVIPVYLRRTRPERFEQGVWNLGRWSGVIGWIAIVWVVFICILFMLPTNSHETSPTDFGDFLTNFNYTPFVLLVVFVLLTIWYMVSVRHWFKGPIAQGTEEQLEAIEAEFGETLGSQGESVAASTVSSGMSGGLAMAMEASGGTVASTSSVEVATLERVEATASEVQEVQVVQMETVVEQVVTEVEGGHVVERQTASGRIISEFERDFSGHLLVNEVHVEEKETRAQERKAAEKKTAKKKIVSEFERDFGGKEKS